MAKMTKRKGSGKGTSQTAKPKAGKRTPSGRPIWEREMVEAVPRRRVEADLARTTMTPGRRDVEGGQETSPIGQGRVRRGPGGPGGGGRTRRRQA